MNREIKFRGQRAESGKWIYGGLFVNDKGVPYIVYSLGILVELDPATVGQYTGLHDENGTEIYEGDILDENCVVSFNCENHGGVWGWNNLTLEGEANMFYYGDSPSKYNIITGNIHEPKGSIHE